jgi:hypothetical protein
MNKMSNRKNKFVAQGAALDRKVNNRNEHQVSEEKPLMLFSFKDFQFNSQIPPGQSYSQWQDDKLLAYMLEKFGYICNENRVEAEQKGFIKVYGKFPTYSKFKNPFPDSDLNWAVVMKIGGQKSRVAGYIDGHVFYVVFLDSEHKFYPAELKHT